jgi:quinol monooxygenase YgiN
MSVIVTLHLKVKPGNFDALKNWLRDELPHTRGFDGCNGITIHRNQDDGDSLVFLEDWDSRPQYEKYLTWRAERGDVEKLAGWLAGEPPFTVWDKVGV